MYEPAMMVRKLSKTDKENSVKHLGLDMLKESQKSQTIFRKNYFSDKMMDWAMQRPELKLDLFRFVDVLPTLVSHKQIVAHLKEYFMNGGKHVPLWMKSGLGVSLSNPVTDRLATFSVKKNVVAMAQSFITGANSSESHVKLKKLWDQGLTFTVDILGEAVISQSEALSYQSKYLELVKGLPQHVESWPERSFLESNSLGALPRANVSVKLTSLYSQMSNLDFKGSVEVLKNRLRPILKEATAHQVFINLDMEQNDYKEMVLTVAEEIFSEDEFKDYPYFGIVIQAYLKSASEDLQRVIDFSSKRKHPLTVRLVKGAYWDYENILADQRDWPVPVFANKHETDAQYERCLHQLMEAYPKIMTAVASHNARSLSYAMVLADQYEIPKSDLEIQMLYGMAGGLAPVVKERGYRVRLYAPVGELLPGMAYLVRRLLENTSNEGFLKQSQEEGQNLSALLADPSQQKVKKSGMKKGQVTKKRKRFIMFKNQSMLDFSKKENRDWMPGAIENWQEQFPLMVPVVVGGERLSNLDSIEVHNPSHKKEIVAHMNCGRVEDVEKAMELCKNESSDWQMDSVEKRAKIITKAADIMLEKRQQLMALIVLESGKTWDEADADVCEAIDFCRYYADLACDMMVDQEMAGVLGESNEFIYAPRGTCAAIAPWNFPLAILCGMTVAPLVCGNPVVMKPAEQTPAIAYQLYQILIEAGVPKQVLHFLPGLGEVVGAALVGHKDMHVISFTGSRDVGLAIIKEAAELKKGQKHIKKVVAEMGGKNALIIDDDADLDEAVSECLHSVFGFAGQKCSALSRIIVLEDIYPKFKERFMDGLNSLEVGAAKETGTKVGPVVDGEAQKRLLKLIEAHEKEQIMKLELPAKQMKEGFFVPPTIFESDDPDSELGQAEFFGPVVTLFKVKDLDEAIRVMNNVDYALTGGVFSRSPNNIEKVRRFAEVGNLYINRGITGALVGRQPFGGFKLSGVGGKAGGPDYLLHFLEPRTITENTMRRGFAPESLNS